MGFFVSSLGIYGEILQIVSAFLKIFCPSQVITGNFKSVGKILKKSFPHR